MSDFDRWWANNAFELNDLDKDRQWIAFKAWKAAKEKAESELEALAAERAELAKLLGFFSDYELPCESVEQAYEIWQYVLDERNELREKLDEAKRALRDELAENDELMNELAVKCACRFSDGVCVTICDYHKNELAVVQDRLSTILNDVVCVKEYKP